MKRFWQNAVAAILSLVCVFATACSTNPSQSGSGGSTGGGASVEPDDYVVTELTVLTPPTKTEYVAGEKFDYAGMVLKAVWNDGEIEEIGAYECDEISPKGQLTKDVTEITFTYYGKTVTQPVTVTEISVTGLTVDTSALSTHVVSGSIVNLNDIVVKSIISKDGKTETKVIDNYTLSENDKQIKNPSRYVVSKGNHVISVEYFGVKKTFTVTGFNSIELIAGTNEADKPNGSHTESYVLNNEGLTELGEYKMYGSYCAQFKAGAKIRFYVYRTESGKANLYFRAACGNGEVQANKCFALNLYKLKSETQAVSEVTAEKIAIGDSVKFGYSSRSETDPDAYKIAWNDYSKEFFVDNVSLQKGWNILEVEFLKKIDVNFKSIIITDREEILAGSKKSSKPNGNNTESYVLDSEGLAELGEYKMYGDYCAQFKAGAKIRFYVYRSEAGSANLYFRAACGSGEIQANAWFAFNLFKPTSETQALTGLTAEKIAMSDDVKFGYSSRSETDPDAYKIAWYDYSREHLVGEIKLQKGWNVIEVEFLKNVDVNFKSIILE